ncbi:MULTISPECIES: hypothetical protein [Streptomyces]|uniref:Regulatory protein FmdB Zinc ribbon domain-containing protein n=1 Tax=Streptomyces gibsoniae TaxID=3075529 RepID=A0ABU2TX22_9ACTN|nr:hypothetical protein [Streptomyces sp. DSM 41699]MDT0465518.1 hypothetical protein [Streptomyces sp. DSM 41699]
MPMYCFTCDTDQPHRELNRAEQSWLEERLGRAAVREFRMCEAVLDTESGKQCRNLRTGGNKKPFARPIRVPVLE